MEAEVNANSQQCRAQELFFPVEVEAPETVPRDSEALVVELKRGHRILIPSSASRETLSNLVVASDSNETMSSCGHRLFESSVQPGRSKEVRGFQTSSTMEG